jgi:ABC-type sugar transport system substrate-binding protein
MAEYRITSWREIPSLVSARGDAGEVVKVPLPDRFQAAIDELAMRTGAAGSDDYLAGWEQGDWVERSGDPGAVAALVAGELGDQWTEDRLTALIAEAGS